MKLKFLGTAAAEGIPAIFCSCETCQMSHTLGGKNLRKRSSLLLDDRIMIDFTNDILHYVHAYQLDLSKLEHLLITHSHSDHFNIFDLEMKLIWFTNPGNPSLNVYANEACIQRVNHIPEKEEWERIGMKDLLHFHTVSRWESFFIKDYKITPLPASHVTSYEGEHSCIYVIEKDKKRILYGLDSGWYQEDTWKYLEEHRFDCIILDCTGAFLHTEEPGNHMTLKENIKVVERLEETGSVDKNTIKISTHFSHNGHVVYDRDYKEFLQKGFLMSYDGLEIQI